MCRYLRSSPRQRERPIGRRRILDGRGFLPVPVTTFAWHGCAWRRRGGTRAMEQSKKGGTMRRQLTAAVSFAFVAASGAALAHHSFAMFDHENPIELEGVVQEFKFTSPHTFIILEVKQSDGTTQLWSLEGAAPSALVREGWSSKTIKSGDELSLRVDPLRSGAPGGSWSV